MAQITQSEWNNYVALLRQLNEKAAMDIVTFMRNRILHNAPDSAIENITSEQRKELLDYAYAIVQQYGEGAAALSAEMYDTVAILEGRFIAPAEMAELAKYGDVAKAINGTLKVSENPDEIASAATRWVKMASADTMLNNALRDGAEFAWVPHGDTCPFCIMLASRGWQHASRKAIKGGHAEHIHSNCDCQYMIRFDNHTNVEGYDPDRYLSMYRNAEGRTPQERINSMRRESHAISHGIDLSQLEYPVHGYADEHFDRKARRYTFSEDLTATNPNYSKGKESGYQDNCQRCVPTYLLRTQGYNVIANPTNFGHDDNIEFMLHRAGFKKYVKSDGTHPQVQFARRSSTYGRTEIEEYMSSLPDGAMLEVSCAWKKGGAHVFVAEKRDGIVHYIDPQSGESDVSYYFTLMRKDNTMFFRIDDTEVNEDYIWYIARNSSR